MVNGIVAMPPKVVKLRFGDPSGAAAEMAKVADICVAVITTLLAVMPVGTASVPFVRLLPVSVTARFVPWEPEAGLIDARVGGGGFMVNATTPLVTGGLTGLVTLTDCGPNGAAAAMANAAVMVVPVASTMTLLAVT